MLFLLAIKESPNKPMQRIGLRSTADHPNHKVDKQ